MQSPYVTDFVEGLLKKSPFSGRKGYRVLAKIVASDNHRARVTSNVHVHECIRAAHFVEVDVDVDDDVYDHECDGKTRTGEFFNPPMRSTRRRQPRYR